MGLILPELDESRLHRVLGVSALREPLPRVEHETGRVKLIPRTPVRRHGVGCRARAWGCELHAYETTTGGGNVVCRPAKLFGGAPKRRAGRLKSQIPNHKE